MGAQPELERSKMLGDEEVAGSEKLVVEPKQNTSLSALSRPATLLLVVGMVCLIGGMSSCTGGAGMTSADTTQDLALRLQTRPSTFFQLADEGITGADVLMNLHSFSTYTSYIVVATGTATPTRRDEDQPFLTVLPGVSLPGAAVLNRAATALEAVLHRRLFPITVRADALVPAFAEGARPYAVFDLSTGVLVVDHSVAQAWRMDSAQYLIGALGDGFFKSLQQVGDLGATAVGGVEALLPLLLTAMAAALATAFSAAPPLWFCLACPTVLGLLAPLAINLGLGQLAGLACTRLALPDDQCFDLLLGALGLGFVLSLASAVPIFLVCKMYECSHRPPAALSAFSLRRLLS